MLRKTKNFLISIYKKKLFWGVSFFILLGMLIPKTSHAGIGAIISVAVIRVAIGTPIAIGVFALKVSEGILSWITGPSPMGQLGYTNTTNNPVLETGLNITQGFVNMLLVLILIYIAIATILRIKEHDTKQLLIRFIGIALLVNFAPVIMGVIVDATNIIMNFFLGRMVQGGIGGVIVQQALELNGRLGAAGDMPAVYPLIGEAVFLLILIFLLAIILFIFAAVFMFRFLAIWMLVILSPLAFAAYILPKTRKHFEAWWSQFIHWAFVGVSCSFFLYLSILLINNLHRITPITIAGQPSFSGVLHYIVAIAFLGMGLIVGLKTSAAGANIVIGAVKRRAKGAVSRTGRIARQAGVGTAKKVWQGGIRPRIEGRVRKISASIYSGMVKAGDWTPGKKGIVKPAAFLKWVAPQKLKDFGNLFPVIEEGMKKAKGQSGMVIGDQIANQKVRGPKATGWYSQLLIQNDSQDLFRSFKRKVGKGAGGKKWKDMSDDEIASDAKFQKIMAPILVHARNSGKLGSTLRRDPRLAEVAYKKNIGSYGRLDKDGKPQMPSVQDAVNKAVTEAREHLKDWEPESLKSSKVTGAVMAHLDRDRQLQVNRQIKDGQDTQHKTMDKMFSDFVRTKSSFSDLNETFINDRLARTGVDEKGNDIESEDFKKAWREFDKYIEKTFGDRKYFISVEEPRMKVTGWRKAKFVQSKKGGVAPEVTPGEATMGGPPPPKGRRPSRPSRTPKGRRSGGRPPIKYVKSKVVKSESTQKPLPPNSKE